MWDLRGAGRSLGTTTLWSFSGPSALPPALGKAMCDGVEPSISKENPPPAQRMVPPSTQLR